MHWVNGQPVPMLCRATVQSHRLRDLMRQALLSHARLHSRYAGGRELARTGRSWFAVVGYVNKAVGNSWARGASGAEHGD